jgi:hypothetical protein
MTHVNNYLRDLFNAWVKSGAAPPNDTSPTPDSSPIRALCRQLIDSTDPLPEEIRELFTDTAGQHSYQTYGDLAARLIPEIDYQEQVAALQLGGPSVEDIKKEFVIVGTGPWGVSMRERVMR